MEILLEFVFGMLFGFFIIFSSIIMILSYEGKKDRRDIFKDLNRGE